MIDKEMRNLIKQFKKTQPKGVRNRVKNQMTEVYEMAEPETQAKMKADLTAHLAGELPEEEQGTIQVINYTPDEDSNG